MQDGTIDRPDIITQKGFTTFEELAKSIDLATVSLTHFIDAGRSAGVNIKAATTTRQLGEEAKKLTIAQTELLKIEKQIETANARANKAYQDQQKALAAIKNEQKERIALGGKEAKLITEQNASVKQLEAALQKNRVAYKMLADEEARNSKEGKELKAIIDQQDAAVKKLNGGLGDFTGNVGNYEGAMKGLKTELKAAKDEMAFLAKNTGTTSPEFVKAAAKAGDLKDQINDLNDQIKITAGSKFENIGNSLKDVGSKLLSLDFEGAANSAKQFAAIMKTLTFKEVIEGVKSFASTLKVVGTAILTSPLFIMVATITAVAVAFQFFKDRSNALSQRMIANYAKESEAVSARYDLEIKLQKIVGKSTFDLEIEKQKALKNYADISAKALGDIEEFTIKGALLEGKWFKQNEEKKKQLEDFQKQSRDAANEIIVLEAEKEKFQKDSSKDVAQQLKEDLFNLNAFRLKIQIEEQEDIANNEKKSYKERIEAIEKFTKLKDKLAKLERDNAISQADLTKDAILLIDLELQKKLADNKRDANKDVESINAERIKADDELTDHYEKNDRKREKSYTKQLTTIGKISVAIKGVVVNAADSASASMQKFFDKLSTQLQEAKKQFDTWASAINDLYSSIAANRIQKLNDESKANEEKLNHDLLLAGDNEKAKDQIRLRAERKELELEKRRRAEARKAAILEKALGIISVAIQTAINITKSYPNPYLMAAAAALGLLETAAIAAKPIPSYFKGTKSHGGGLAQVGEQGQELMIKPGGGLELTPSSSTIMDLPRGTEVVPHAQTMRMLALGALQSNGGSRVVSHDPALLNELKEVNSNLKNIKHPKFPSLVNSSGTVYQAMEEKKGHIKIRRSINLGKFLE